MNYDPTLKKQFTASALILNDEKKVLLVYHKKYDVWLYPGGHIEDNETPDEAVIREVKEETSLNVEIIGNKNLSIEDKTADVTVLHKPYEILCERIQGKKMHYHIDMIYICRIISNSKLEYNKNESSGIGFFSYDDIKKLPLFPNFKNLLSKFFDEIN